jgi:hypothetical protein
MIVLWCVLPCTSNIPTRTRDLRATCHDSRGGWEVPLVPRFPLPTQVPPSCRPAPLLNAPVTPANLFLHLPSPPPRPTHPHPTQVLSQRQAELSPGRRGDGSPAPLLAWQGRNLPALLQVVAAAAAAAGDMDAVEQLMKVRWGGVLTRAGTGSIARQRPVVHCVPHTPPWLTGPCQACCARHHANCLCCQHPVHVRLLTPGCSVTSATNVPNLPVSVPCLSATSSLSAACHGLAGPPTAPGSRRRRCHQQQQRGRPGAVPFPLRHHPLLPDRQRDIQQHSPEAATAVSGAVVPPGEVRVRLGWFGPAAGGTWCHRVATVTSRHSTGGCHSRRPTPCGRCKAAAGVVDRPGQRR